MSGGTGAPEETVRLHQANERTMLAWVRTGISLMMLGFTMARFGLFLEEMAGKLPGASSAAESEWMGAALVTIGVAVNLGATLRFGTVRRAILRGELGAPNATAVYAMGAALTAVGGIMTFLLVRSLTA